MGESYQEILVKTRKFVVFEADFQVSVHGIVDPRFGIDRACQSGSGINLG